LVGNEDADFAGGSYVVVQKYLHDLNAWARIPTRLQEEIIGRSKLDNIEIDDDDAARKIAQVARHHRGCRGKRI
jgi:putative iron-dependent peroxidase